MSRFQDQVAIVTGSAAGIGLGIATRLGREGARVLMVDYDGAQGERSAADLTSQGMDVRLEVGDVGDEEVARRSVARALEAWGRIDVLVNNAGITGNAADIWELPVDELDRVYRTNLRGVFCFCRHAIPPMMERDYGRIVNIASIAGKEGNPKMVPYSATKAAVIGLTKSVGKELARTGIRVNCVAPAVLQTTLLDQLTPDRVEYMLERIPMGRFGEIEELASLVAWLASPECSFSTGAVFDLSGGRATY
jgi:NAD(P)-dependent dehydrogenase (short-subunit alcohol dehydrogenase family)